MVIDLAEEDAAAAAAMLAPEICFIPAMYLVVSSTAICTNGGKSGIIYLLSLKVERRPIPLAEPPLATG